MCIITKTNTEETEKEFIPCNCNEEAIKFGTVCNTCKDHEHTRATWEIFTEFAAGIKAHFYRCELCYIESLNSKLGRMLVTLGISKEVRIDQ